MQTLPPDAVITTARTYLRPFVDADFQPLFTIFSDPVTMEHYPSTFSREKTRNWIVRNQQRWTELGQGLFAIVRTADQRIIGDCGVTLQNIDGELLPEIGYHISRDLWRQGFGSEAARAVRDWAFATLGYPALYSYMRHNNVASSSTARAAGMRLWKQYVQSPDVDVDVYRIGRNEWELLVAADAPPSTSKKH